MIWTHYLGNEIKVEEGGSCGKDGRGESCIQAFGGET